MKPEFLKFALLILIALGLGGFLSLIYQPSTSNIIQQSVKTVESYDVQIGAPFKLTSHMNEPATQNSWPDSYKLVFFGFTNCMDICPSSLQKITDMLDELGKTAEEIQPLFITIDPERDNVVVMADYLQAFSSKIVGLTGTAKEIDDIKEGYRLYARKRDGSNGQIDHSASLYFMAPDGRYITMFSGSATVEEMAAQIKVIVENKEKM